jgi:hypothetical protein
MRRGRKDRSGSCTKRMNVRERSLLKERAGSLFKGIERSLLKAGVL